MTLTPEQFEAKMQQKFRQLDKMKLIYPVATKVHDDMTRRLFGKGIDGGNQALGTYGTRESYFTKKQFKKTGAFRSRGKKSNKSTFKNGNPRQSMYIKDGYKGLKAAQGYVSDKVNLTYSADLRQDFATKLAPLNNTLVVKLSRQINANKVKWLTDKYGPQTFKHTKEEKEFFAKEVTKRLTAYLSA